jgi:hypothetical protein
VISLFFVAVFFEEQVEDTDRKQQHDDEEEDDSSWCVKNPPFTSQLVKIECRSCDFVVTLCSLLHHHVRRERTGT